MRIGFFVVPGSARPQEVPEADVVDFTLEDPTPEAMLAATRTSIDVLWVDLPVLREEMRALRQIRTARPTTRIIIAHDPHLSPPHPLMAQLVGLGIYDLVPDTKSLLDVLTQRATFADAARWHAELPTTTTQSTPIDAFLSPSAEGRTLWHKHLVGSAPRKTPRDLERTRILRPRRLLVVGSQGGVGTSSIVAALAKAWEVIGMPVVAVDASRHGGWLPLAWSGEPVDIGWDAGLKPEAAWRLVSRQTYLLAQSGLARSAEPGPDPQFIERLHTAFARSPAPSEAVWIIDAGTAPGWSGALQHFIDGTILVTTATTTGQYAGARQHAILAAGGPPLLGVIVNRHQSGHPNARAIAESWDGTALAEIPEHPAAWEAFWDGRTPAAVSDALGPVAHQLLDSTGSPIHTKGWISS